MAKPESSNRVTCVSIFVSMDNIFVYFQKEEVLVTDSLVIPLFKTDILIDILYIYNTWTEYFPNTVLIKFHIWRKVVYLIGL